jgi:DUF1365 family protein
MFYLDLDELDALSRHMYLFGRNRRAVYSFRDDDHLAAAALPLKRKLVDHLAAAGVHFDPAGRVMLLTLPRVLGYIFNPISIYFCFDCSGTPHCALAEVGNTFGEKKLFLLRPEQLHEQTFRLKVPKHYYVSPFSSLTLQFDFRLRTPGSELDIRIDDCDGEAFTLRTALAGRRLPLSDARLSWFTLKYPLLTLKVIALIHWHALRLWWKGVPWHRKAAHPELQREVLRPRSEPRPS